MKRKSIIPGFGISFGITITILSIVVLIPLCSLVIFSAELSFSDFIHTVTRPRVLSSYFVSISTAFIASVVRKITKQCFRFIKSKRFWVCSQFSN